MTKTTPTNLPPTPPTKPILGNIHQLREQNILLQMIEFWETYGDLFALKLGSGYTYVLTHPDHLHHVLVTNQKNYHKGAGYDSLRLLIGNGLITSDGEQWRQQRRIMQPSFTPSSITQFTDMMSEITAKLLGRWHTAADKGTIVNVDDEMLRLTMSIISKAMFSIDLEEDLQEVGNALQEGFDFIAGRNATPLRMPLSIPTAKNRRFKQALDIIDSFIYERIAVGQQKQEADDLLSILLQAKDEETGQTMDKQQLRDEAVTLFFAGFETTARTLTWGWHLLTQHPEVMTKLEEEADEQLNGRLPTVGDLYNLTYTRMVTDETLRLYPPTGLLGRQAVEEDVIGGYPIPAGSRIILIPHVTHRHPDIWENPAQFDPERFTAEKVKTRPKSAYIPFANGPRVCIGNNFALMEMVIALSTIANRFRLERVTAAIPFEFHGTTRPTTKLQVKIHHRS